MSDREILEALDYAHQSEEALLRRAQAAEDALEKALPFIGSAASRSQIICGVDAGELYFVIEELLSKAKGQSPRGGLSGSGAVQSECRVSPRNGGEG